MQSSKLATKARFPSPAPLLTLTIRFGGVIGAGGKLKTSNLKHGGLNFEIGTLQYPPVVQATPHPHSDNPLCARCRSFCAWNLALGTGNFASLACPFLPVTTHLVPRTINLVNGAGDLALRTPDLAVWAPALHAFSASDFPRPSDGRGCGKAGEAHDAEKFIHIPSTASHATAKQAMDGLSSSLASLSVTVSTGRVVDFRLKASLRKDPQHGTVPLIYPCHFSSGTVHWPKLEARKPNAILDNDETRPWLVPSGVYLLTKRFTSKEERRRVVACLFDPDRVKAEWVGFENHLNYFHASGYGLDRSLAVGLFAFLNSTVVDQYFRRFSGHTQVNATDLRTLLYPDRETLQAMGRDLKTLDLSQDQIDLLVTEHLHARR